MSIKMVVRTYRNGSMTASSDDSHNAFKLDYKALKASEVVTLDLYVNGERMLTIHSLDDHAEADTEEM